MASAFVGDDQRLYLVKWTGETWEGDSFAAPPYMSLIGFSPGIAYAPQVALDDALTGYVTALDSNGNSLLQRFAWRRPPSGSVFAWHDVGHLPYGRQYQTEAEADVLHHTVVGAVADNRGRLLIPMAGQGGAMKVNDVGPPDHAEPNTFAFTRPALHRVGTTRYVFATATASGTLIVATETAETSWHWRSLGAPHGRKVKSAPAAIDYARGDERVIEAFAICDDGHLWSCARHGDTWHWFDRGAPPSTLYGFSRPAAVSFVDPVTGALQIMIFVFDIDHHLLACRLDGHRFAWSALGAPAGVELAFDIAPGAASALRGSTRYVHVFVRGTASSGPRMYQCQWDGRAWWWQDFGAMGRFHGATVAPPAPVPPTGHPFYFRITAPGLAGFCSVVRVDAADAAGAKLVAQAYCTNCSVEAVDANATCNGF